MGRDGIISLPTPAPIFIGRPTVLGVIQLNKMLSLVVWIVCFPILNLVTYEMTPDPFWVIVHWIPCKDDTSGI